MSTQPTRTSENPLAIPAEPSEGRLHPPAHYGPLRRIWWWFDFLILVNLARLRFVAILAIVGAVILYWETLTSYYERWTRPLRGETAVAASDSEYWCPMHPTIIREKPDKCPICGMPLSKRKKGEHSDQEEALPPGVVSRVQLTPYKVVNAGIQTVEVGYQPLTKDISTVGFVEYDERKLSRITARPAGKSRIEKLFVNVTGQKVQKGEPLAELYSPELLSTVTNLLDARQAGNRDIERGARDRLRLWGIDDAQIEQIVKDGKPITHMTIRSSIGGLIIKKYQVEGDYVEEGARLYDVADLTTVWIEAQVYEDDISYIKEGLPVSAVTKTFPNRQFRGIVAFLDPHLNASTRTLRVRFDMENKDHDLRHGMFATVTIQVPAVRLNALAADASEEQKRMQGQGLVLAVPERAVIDTGSRKIVYRESEQDVFDGVEVQLGQRCGAFYPVLQGLRAGDRVAATGSFLIDAETRLTGGASSTYFGASFGPHGNDNRYSATSARPSMTRDETDNIEAALAKLSPEDRKLAEAQVYCPILTDNRLGVMGKPEKILLKGKPVFLCCKACVNKALSEEVKTLAKLDEVTKRGKADLATAATSPAPQDGTKNSKLKVQLAKLSAEDRRLAEEQGFCPQSNSPLGSMGVPIKLLLQGQPVFVCCSGCVDDVKQHPQQTLEAVAKFKRKTGAGQK
jgi:Cu(I)/Ag(I) efflux system membrane fusion protein